MKEILANSTVIGFALSLLGYELGLYLRKRCPFALGKALLNPLLLAIFFVLAFLLLTDTSLEVYQQSASHLQYLLTPATIALAIPLYQQIQLLKQYKGTILVSTLVGSLSGLLSIYLLAKLFDLSKQQFVTLLPKSITTAIGIGLSEELGGLASLTVAVIVLTGILGNCMADGLCRLFRLRHPLAKGLAVGTAAHAIGTAKAMEWGEVEAAMSSLALVLTGLYTVIGAAFLAQWY